MKNKCILSIALLVISAGASGQVTAFSDSAAAYFREIQAATQANEQLWNLNLYGPVLLLRPATRQVFANSPDSAGVLQKDGLVYTGSLPRSLNIANTSVHWGGRNWAMVMLPLPADKNQRLDLLAHELFHRSQPVLGFRLHDASNNQLDSKEGRIYLRLELEALKDALQAGTGKERMANLTNAFIFRKYRYTVFPGADSTENMLELNEGLAEYTGVMMSGRNESEMKDHFTQSIHEFINNPTYVRSFPYQTIPLYGYLLHFKDPDWNKKINSRTNLTAYFIKAFHIQFPGDLAGAVKNITDRYNGREIIAEEDIREEKIMKIKAGYRERFIDQPHLEIHFTRMNFSFDPRNIMPLDTNGTVYPSMRISDDWGILTVTKGALLGAHWDKLTVSRPTHIDNEKATGDGWVLELNNGYRVKKDSTGNYMLEKQ